MTLAARAVIAADREKAGIFALRAGIRLQGDRVIAGDLAQPVACQVLEQLVIALRLIGRRERMQIAPNSGQVTGIISAVALSFMVQEPSGIIARSSARSRSARLAHVTQHFGFGAIAVENRVIRKDEMRSKRLGNVPAFCRRSRQV